MTPLIEACIVLATISLIVLVFVTIRLVNRLRTLTDAAEVTLRHVEGTLDHSRANQDKIERILGELEQIAHAVRGGALQLTGVVDRTANVATTLLDEVQRPAQRVVALIHGVQAGARVLARRAKATDGTSNTHEGEHNV